MTVVHSRELETSSEASSVDEERVVELVRLYNLLLGEGNVSLSNYVICVGASPSVVRRMLREAANAFVRALLAVSARWGWSGW